MSGLIASLVVALLTASPPNDPPVAKVNLRTIFLSELQVELAAGNAKNIEQALENLAIQKLLLQEADVWKHKLTLPSEPADRARAFLHKVVSERTICGNITQRNMDEMYRVMKPRFVHGDLYRIAHLQWYCSGNGLPEHAACKDRGQIYSMRHWRPFKSLFKAAEDLFWLVELAPANLPLRYGETTVHVDFRGKTNAPPELLDAVKTLSVGEATVVSHQRGSSVVMLLSHRPPSRGTLDNPAVARQVRSELCPRLLKRHRSQYVHDLLKTASIQVFKENLPGQETPE